MPNRSMPDRVPRVDAATSKSSQVASVDDAIVRIVTDFVECQRRSHAIVVGGLGTGKSRALGVAALAAGASGARVAWLEHGFVGISSFDDFLAAVDEAVSGAAFRPAPTSDAKGSAPAFTALGDKIPLVIVMEGLDQLVRQLRANDRPALLDLLDDEHGPLLIGTAVLGSLSDEFVGRFTVLRTAQLFAPISGVLIAMERAAERRVLEPSAKQKLLNSAMSIAPTLTGNQMFW
jgi:hypothetical protein